MPNVVALVQDPILRFVDNSGQPLVGGTLLTQVGGSNYPTWSDSLGTIQNTNPIVLNARGEIGTNTGVSSPLFVTPNVSYTYSLFDAQGNLIWSAPNITSPSTVNAVVAGLTQSALGAILYPQTQAEINANVVPINLWYEPGNVLRYGADPTGNADSVAAWTNAIAANAYVFDGFPTGGTYLLSSSIQFTRFPLHIHGIGVQYGSTTGTVLNLAASAGASVGALQATQSIYGFQLDGITFNFADATLGQIGLFCVAELRAAVIWNNYFATADQSSANTTQGIVLSGGTVFSGAVTIRDNNFANLLIGIALSGNCTTVRIRDNEIYGNTSAASSIGIDCGVSVQGASIFGNTLEGWTQGIFFQGKYLAQGFNHFEGNGTNWTWQRGAGNSRIWAMSFADMLLTGGAPVYPINGTDLCMVIGGPGTADMDLTVMNAESGFSEHLRAYNAGDRQVPTFAAGNFTGNGSMTWTVAAQASFWYSIIGHTLKVGFNIQGTVGGTPNTTLQIAIPGGFVAADFASNSCDVLNGGSWSASTCQVGASGGTVIQIFTGPAASGNWTAGAVQVTGQIDIPVQ